MHRFDIVVVGTGPAGQRAAIQAAKLGRSVAAIERRHVLGGVCVNGGTIPSKTLREAVLDLSGYRRRIFAQQPDSVGPTVTLNGLLQQGLQRWQQTTERSESSTVTRPNGPPPIVRIPFCMGSGPGFRNASRFPPVSAPTKAEEAKG